MTDKERERIEIENEMRELDNQFRKSDFQGRTIDEAKQNDRLVKCEDCDGEGKNSHGSDCSLCGGKGKLLLSEQIANDFDLMNEDDLRADYDKSVRDEANDLLYS